MEEEAAEEAAEEATGAAVLTAAGALPSAALIVKRPVKEILGEFPSSKA
jgi:hypothetical protein